MASGLLRVLSGKKDKKDKGKEKFCVENKQEEGLVCRDVDDGFLRIDRNIAAQSTTSCTSSTPVVARLACQTPSTTLPSMLIAEQLNPSKPTEQTAHNEEAATTLPAPGTPTLHSAASYNGRALFPAHDDEENQSRSSAAAEAILAHMPQLAEQINLVKITPHLIGYDVIDQHDFDQAQNPYPDKQRLCNRLLSQVVHNVKGNYRRFGGFCCALDATKVDIRGHVKDHYRDNIQSKNLEAVLRLDEPTADMGASSGHFEQTALHTATQQKEVSTVEVLLQQDQGLINKQDSHGNTALHIAANNGSMEIVRMLLQNNADTKIPNLTKSRLPLHLAIATQDDCLPVVELLVDHDKQSVNSTDQAGNTALVLACKRNRLPVAELLLRTEFCTPYCPNKKSRTALFYAALIGNMALVDLLLQYDRSIAFISHHDKNGDNPLHIAAWKGHLEVVKRLCEFDEGLNILKDTKNNNQRRPIDIAKQCQHSDIVRQLEPLRRCYSTPSGGSAAQKFSRSQEKDILYSPPNSY